MCEMYNGKKCGLQVDEFQPGWFNDFLKRW
jgi:hypothetical protein